ncbi:hypothetical protein C8R46DRAFT_1058880 [Mycena filopes]|nr:hypothetical protein C8R46DRAFT_1058880 [Mycena filopes]
MAKLCSAACFLAGPLPLLLAADGCRGLEGRNPIGTVNDPQHLRTRISGRVPVFLMVVSLSREAGSSRLVSKIHPHSLPLFLLSSVALLYAAGFHRRSCDRRPRLDLAHNRHPDRPPAAFPPRR